MLKIIAEAGCNWTTMKEAFKFIEKSKELGLWATKFQIYNKENIKSNPNKIFLESIRITKTKAYYLLKYGEQIGQNVFFSVMYPEAVDWLEELQVSYYKIRYKDQNNVNLLEKIASTKKPTFLSCDQSYLNWYSLKNMKVDVDYPRFLYCVPKYPAVYNDYLRNMPTSSQMKMFAGISDHTSDLRLLEEAMWHGVLYFEKHLMLDGTEPLEKDWSVSFSQLREVLNK